jgi:hypothetical protein
VPSGVATVKRSLPRFEPFLSIRGRRRRSALDFGLGAKREVLCALSSEIAWRFERSKAPLICKVNEDATREVVAIHAGNVGDTLSGPWRVHTSTKVLQGDRLVVTSTADSESTFPGTSGIPSFSKTAPFENGCT